MANKFISDFPKDTTPTGTDMFLMEKVGAAGVFEHQVRSDIHKLKTGEFLDTGNGVNLLLKAAGNQAITISANNGNLTIAQTTTHQGPVICEDFVRVNAGIRVQTSLEYYVAGERRSGTLRGGGDGGWGFVAPTLALGATGLTIRANEFAQVSGALSAVVATVTLITPTGTTYTADTASTTWANLGEDKGSVLQTAVASALSSFSSGEGRAFTAGDSVYLTHDTLNTIQIAVELEVVHT